MRNKKFNHKFNLQFFAEKSLKDLLGEELHNQVTEAIGDKELAIINDGNWIPRVKFNNLNEENKQYKDQIEDLDAQLKDLKKETEGNEAATQRITDLEARIEEQEKEMGNLRKSNQIKLEVLKAAPRDIKDILPHLDQDTIKYEDGKLTGLKEQLDNLKEAKSYLFQEEKPTGTGGSKGNSAKGSNRGELTKEDFQKMNIHERTELFNKDRETYDRLK